MEKELKVVNESLNNSGIRKDYKDAICEYVWNGFDAEASIVKIDYKVNELDGVESIKIKDNGYGINYENLDNTFSAFLSSEKKGNKTLNPVHGSKGKGRFSFLGFAHNCKWNTVYLNKENYMYSIEIDSRYKNKYQVSDKEKVDKDTGTCVEISQIEGLTKDSMESIELKQVLLNNFSWYLFLKKEYGYKIILNGKELQYSELINEELSEEITININQYSFNIFFINWKENVNSKFFFHMMDSNFEQSSKEYTKYNNNGIGFFHSVYIISNYFDDFVNMSYSDEAQITIDDGIKSEKDPTYKELLKKLNEIVGKKYKQFVRQKSNKLIEGFESEKVFPEFSQDKYGQIRKKDLENVVREVYCVQPKIFKGANIEQKKVIVQFLDLLLNSEERENILIILDNIIKLTKEERETLVNILDKTKLNNIISMLKILEDRQIVVNSLKKIIFELTDYTNERNHIQKIMEKNYWLFGEEYNLITADKHFQKALEEYEYKLYGYRNKDDYKIEDIQRNRRMDIFLAAKRKLNSFSNASKLQENIILELKAPSIPISVDIFRQIEDYMELIKNEPRFNSVTRMWKFYAISSEVDNFIKTKYEEYKEKGEPFLVKSVKNCKIYVMTWDDVFRNFEENYNFLYEKLNFDKEKLENEIIAEDNNREGVDKIVNETLNRKVI
jgi:hypothetical protein